MDFLSARNVATLPPPKYPTYSKGITRVIGRDIRARVEGNRAG